MGGPPHSTAPDAHVQQRVCANPSATPLQTHESPPAQLIVFAHTRHARPTRGQRRCLILLVALSHMIWYLHSRYESSLRLSAASSASRLAERPFDALPRESIYIVRDFCSFSLSPRVATFARANGRVGDTIKAPKFSRSRCVTCSKLELFIERTNEG